MCRQDPMPLVNEDTGESYSDEFFPDEEFFYACYSGHLEWFYLRLAQVGSVNGTMADGFTALMMAADGGQFEIARVLIQVGANVNARRSNAGDLNGWTVLMSAARGGRLEIARLLIEMGARVNDATATGCSALMVAAENGALKVVELLIEKGANVNARRSDAGRFNGWTALMSAAQTGQSEVARLLIEKGASVNACRSNAGGAVAGQR